MPIYKWAFNYCPFINGHLILMPVYKRASFQCPFINRPLPIYKWACYFRNLFVNRHVSRCLFTNGQAAIWFIALYYKANCFTLNQLFMVLTTNITTVASRGANLLCLLACTTLCITFPLAVTLKTPCPSVIDSFLAACRSTITGKVFQVLN